MYLCTLKMYATCYLCFSVLGHEATAIVESVGEGVASVKTGDVVIPCYTPECKGQDCIFCQSDKTNLCPKIRAFQGSGVMPDGTSRISKDGKEIFHFMGCSTFAEYAVIAEISAAKIHPGADLNKMCLLVIELLKSSLFFKNWHRYRFSICFPATFEF